jgi:arsenate reductase
MPTRVLFICTGNSARSQMAEGLLRHFAGDQFEVYSAGLEPQAINPFAIRVMQEIGLDISGQRSKSVVEYLGRIHMGIVITVCSKAEANCPIFPFTSVRLYWPFEDPADFTGAEDETLQKFRATRDQVSERLQAWLREQGIEPPPLPLPRSLT